MRIGPGTDDELVQLVDAARFQVNCADPVRIPDQCHDIILDDGSTVPNNIRRDGFHRPARIGEEVPAAMERAAVHGGSDGGFEFAHFMSRKPLGREAMGILGGTFRRIRLILCLVFIEAQRVLIFDEVCRACRLEKCFEIAHHPHGQAGAGLGDRLHPVGERVAGQRHEPWQRLWQVGPADREGAQRVHQPARNLQQHVGVNGRHDFREGEATRIAEGAAFAGRHAVDDGDLVTFTLQEGGGGHADDAGADDGGSQFRHDVWSAFPKKSTQCASKAETRRVLRICLSAARAMTPRSTSSAMGRTASASPA